jgi:hypothetical protein
MMLHNNIFILFIIEIIITKANYRNIIALLINKI